MSSLEVTARAAGSKIPERAAGATSHDNVDPREAAYYAALAERWWDRGGPFWPLHRLNALRTDYLREVLAGAFGRAADALRPLHGLRVLDVGCSGGILTESLAALGAEYVLRWLPRGTHRWRRFVRPDELDGLIAREGLLPLTRPGVWVNPLTRRFSLTARMAVNYMLVTRRTHPPVRETTARARTPPRPIRTTEKLP